MVIIKMKMKKKDNNKILSSRMWESIPVGIYQTRIEDGTFVMINPYGAKMLGFNNPDEVIGKVKSSDFYCNERRQELLDILERDGEISDFEICLNIPKKGKIWVCATAKLVEEDGVIEGSLTDITKRKIMEEEIKSQHAIEFDEIQEKINKKILEYDKSPIERKSA